MLPADLKSKIAPLLRLQASPLDGERANASAAITRLLQRYGVDWHDLAEILLAEPKATAPEPPPGASTWKRSEGAIDLPRDQLIALLDIVEEKSPFLSFKSREFVTSLRARAWRPVTHLSERQWHWLQSLLEDVGI
jgi:hypothetical protein